MRTCLFEDLAFIYIIYTHHKTHTHTHTQRVRFLWTRILKNRIKHHKPVSDENCTLARDCFTGNRLNSVIINLPHRQLFFRGRTVLDPSTRPRKYSRKNQNTARLIMTHNYTQRTNASADLYRYYGDLAMLGGHRCNVYVGRDLFSQRFPSVPPKYR